MFKIGYVVYLSICTSIPLKNTKNRLPSYHSEILDCSLLYYKSYDVIRACDNWYAENIYAQAIEKSKDQSRLEWPRMWRITKAS